MAGAPGHTARPVDLVERFDRLFDDWLQSLPLRRPLLFSRCWPVDEAVRLDEYRDGNDLVIRAELPGVDPEHDVDVVVADGVLRITARRRPPDDVDDQAYLRREIRSGSLSRSVPLPDGVAVSDVSACYHNGVLSIRLPWDRAEPDRQVVTLRF